MGNWHAQDGGEKERRVQQQEKPSGGEGALARSATEGLSNKGLQSILPGLSIQLKGTGGAVLDDTIASAIHNKRGNGEPLDAHAAGSIGKSMGQDFSDVTIHRDGESDTLNKQVSAEAFTTGKDIFFREGKYDPVSNEGQKLLAHELTHVVQQRNAPPASELRVSDPNEASEQQAKSVADTVTSPSSASAGAGGAGGSVGRVEDESSLDRQAMMHGGDEEKEQEGETSMAMSAARAESEEQEDEGVATQVARAESEEQEDEGVATQVARAESEEQEDEGVATQVARAESEEQEDEGVATQVAREEADEDHAGHDHA